MKDSIFLNADLKTPCYVYDQAAMQSTLENLERLSEKTGLKPLYSIKAANIAGLLRFIQPFVTGFSCSSLFELQLSSEIIDSEQSLHITTPAYRSDECAAIFSIADYTSLNSISQWQQLAKRASLETSCGIRLNPELSFVKDMRYDPCRPFSKLGVTNEQLSQAVESGLVEWHHIDGIHLHNNCESIHYEELRQSVENVLALLSEYQAEIKWFNLGGGYLLQEGMDDAPLFDAITAIRKKYDAEIFLEPGKAITGHAGYLIASVIDIIEHEEKHIALLDTSINHLPEVFEYQYSPSVVGSNDSGPFQYRLAGSSCLSGDLFGDYAFDEQLKPGSRIVFKNVGAYMQVKANMFNGINLPATYLFDGGDSFELIKQHEYDDFRRRM